MGTRWRQVLGVLAAVALWAHGLAALLSRVEGQVIDAPHEGSRGSKLATTVYVPTLGPNSRPLRAVVIAHAGPATRRQLDPLARELTRRGFLAVTFDFGGRGDSEDRPGEPIRDLEDVKTAITLARQHGAFGPLALVAHGAGVDAVSRAALDDDEVACLIALGGRPWATVQRPPAILVGAGVMDAFHPYPSLADALREATATTNGVVPFETIKDPQSKSIRRLVYSGSCEHAGEIWDPSLLGETVAFIENAVWRPIIPIEPPFVWRPAAAVSLRFVGSLAAAVAMALAGLALGGLIPREGGPSAQLARRYIAAGLLAASLIPLGAARLNLVTVEVARAATPALLIGALVASAILAGRQDKPATPSIAIATAASLAIAWIGGTALGAVPAYVRHPGLLASLPLWIWQGIAFRLQYMVEVAASWLILAPLGGPPRGALALWALVGLELALPGTALSVAGRFAVRIFRALGGRVPEAGKRAKDTDPPPVPRWKLAVALAVVVGLALWLFHTRTSEGLLSEEGALGSLLLLLARVLVLPLVVMTATVWILRLGTRAA